MDFKQADEEFRQLKARYEAEELTEAEFRAQLQDLMVQDERGNWWMIGYETELWYRHDGTNWVQSDPPGGYSYAAAQAMSSKLQATENIGMESAARAPEMRSAAAEPANHRRSLFPATAIVVFIILSIGGYYLFRNPGHKAAVPLAPTQQKTITVTVTLTPRPSHTPRPTTEPSQTPRPSLTPEPKYQVKITTSLAELHQGPGNDYGHIGSYSKGDVLSVIARAPDALWFLVRASDGAEGWLYVQWIDADFDVLLVPTAATLPPPPPAPTRKPKGGNTPSCFGC